VSDPVAAQSLSTILTGIARTAGSSSEAKVSLNELVAGFGNRAFGLLFLMFGLPNCLPMPPGLPVLCGVVVMVVALQMLLGMSQLLLPGWLGNRQIDRAMLNRVVEKATGPLRWMERLAKPRFPLLSGDLMRRAVGLAGLALGVALMAPIPVFGGIPAGIAVTILGLAFTQRDGLLMVFGVLVATPVALAVTSAMIYALFQGAAAFF